MSTSAASRKPQGWVTSAVNRGIPRFEAGTRAAANAACTASDIVHPQATAGDGRLRVDRRPGKELDLEGPPSTMSQPSSLNVDLEREIRTVKSEAWHAAQLERQAHGDDAQPFADQPGIPGA